MTFEESAYFPLLGTNESNSSKNKMQGELFLAFSKISLTFFSLSPMYIFNNSGPFTEKKFIWHSFAIHFANNVFPVPIKLL